MGEEVDTVREEGREMEWVGRRDILKGEMGREIKREWVEMKGERGEEGDKGRERERGGEEVNKWREGEDGERAGDEEGSGEGDIHIDIQAAYTLFWNPYVRPVTIV